MLVDYCCTLICGKRKQQYRKKCQRNYFCIIVYVLLNYCNKNYACFNFFYFLALSMNTLKFHWKLQFYYIKSVSFKKKFISPLFAMRKKYFFFSD